MEFLSQQGIDYIDKDVSRDPTAVEELIRLGSHSTPTILVDGQVMIGFQKNKLLEMLGAS